MSKGLKIFLIGCGGVALLVVVALTLSGYYAQKWFRGAVGYYEEEEKRRESLSREYTFHPPENNLITENQLKRFLSVRKDVYSVYKKHEKDIEKMNQADKESLSGVMKGVELLKELHAAHMDGLEKAKMSPEEYQYLVMTVYKTWMAKGLQSADSEIQKSLEQLEQQLADPNTPEETKEQLKLTKQTLEQQLSFAQSTGVSKENLELFKKYESEIQQYSMGGLEFAGL